MPPSLPPDPPAIYESFEQAGNVNGLFEQLGDIVSFGEAAENKLKQDDEMEAASETSPETGQGPPPEDESTDVKFNENEEGQIEWDFGIGY